MSKFWIIALDVYQKYVKNVSFLVMTLAPVIAIAGISLTAAIFSPYV
jgi:ABC-2 type transport system permease protein